jgi:alpha-N-arabinofuranosidase
VDRRSPPAGGRLYIRAESIATFNREAEEVTLFAVNRNAREELVIEGKLAGFDGYRVREHIVLAHADPKAANTKANPANVTPRSISTTSVDKGVLRAVLPRLSWNVIRLGTGGRT